MRIVEVNTPELPVFEGVRVPFTQSQQYDKWRTTYGAPMIRSIVKDGERTVGFARWIQIRHSMGPLGAVQALYAPYGLCFAKDTEVSPSALKQALYEFGKKQGVGYVRVDVSPLEHDGLARAVSPRLRFSFQQPKQEQHLSLENGYDAVLTAMKQSGRYGISRATRNGFSVRVERTQETVEDCIRLIKETARQKNFSLHPDAYYTALFNALSEDELFVVCVYSENGGCEAAGCFVFLGTETFFLFGGSTTGGEQKYASYLLQAGAIQEAIHRGSTLYNFGGISDEKKNSLHGVTVFKRKFGGYSIDTAHPVDVVISPFRYNVYTGLKYIQYIRDSI